MFTAVPQVVLDLVHEQKVNLILWPHSLRNSQSLWSVIQVVLKLPQYLLYWRSSDLTDDVISLSRPPFCLGRWAAPVCGSCWSPPRVRFGLSHPGWCGFGPGWTWSEGESNVKETNNWKKIRAADQQTIAGIFFYEWMVGEMDRRWQQVNYIIVQPGGIFLKTR